MADWVDAAVPHLLQLQRLIQSKSSLELNSLLSSLEGLTTLTNLPPAFISQINRTIILIEKYKKSDSSILNGEKKIITSIKKMVDKIPEGVSPLVEEKEEESVDLVLYNGLAIELLESIEEIKHMEDMTSMPLVTVFQKCEALLLDQDLQDAIGVIYTLLEKFDDKPDVEILDKFYSFITSILDSIKSGAKPEITPAIIRELFLKDSPDSKPDDTDGNKDLLLQFVANQNDVLAFFEAIALNFDEEPEDMKVEAKPILHTWKGEFGVLDMPSYASLCHLVEGEIEENKGFHADTLFRMKDLFYNRFKEIKGSGGDVKALTEKEMDFVLAPSKDAAEQKAIAPVVASSSYDGLFDPSAQFPINDDIDLVQGFITEAKEHLDIADARLLELESDPHNRESIDALFRAYHTIKGVSSFLALEPIRYLSHTIEDCIDGVRNGKLALNRELIDASLKGTDILKELIDNMVNSLNIGTYAVPAELDKTISDLKKFSVKKSEKQEQKPVVTTAVAATEVVEEVQPTVEPVIRNKKVNAISETVRIPVDRLDALMDVIGEAVIAQSMVVADPHVSTIKNQDLTRKISQAEQIMRQLQELSMSLRMVSVKPTFQKMARLVRDLSRKFNKPIEFCMEGEDTDIDKSLVENIGDPLIHMVRNAIDHGIETSTEERVELGKPEVATITLRAFHKSGSIYIEIEDDGRGLNTDVIYKKALSQGLISEQDDLNEQEVFQLIFAPGFSTAAEITDISGRGVGMDVVMRNIQDLRGAVMVSSELGKGTTFSIRLPLTLAIIDGMVISSCGERYIIPKLSIVESLTLKQAHQETILGKQGTMFKFRGGYLPSRKLSAIFSLDECSNQEDGRIVVVEDLNGRRMGLIVDEIHGQQQVVIKNLGSGMENVEGVSGGAIMSDGSVNLILDIAAIVLMSEIH